MTTASAVDAAVALAREHGLRVESPRLLAETNNVLVELAPAPLVARVAKTIGRVRPDGGGEHLRRELELALFVHDRGGPVVPPSPLLPPRVHEVGERRITFWERADGESAASLEEAAPVLRELHELIADYAGDLQPLSPVLVEVETMVAAAEAGGGIDRGGAAVVLSNLDGLGEKLRARGLRHRPLHGDAHRGNLLRIGERLVWNDLEDACLAPIEWDVACLVRAFEPLDGELGESYGADVDLGTVELMIGARMIQAAAWTALLAVEDPSQRRMRDRFVDWVATNEGGLRT